MISLYYSKVGPMCEKGKRSFLTERLLYYPFSWQHVSNVCGRRAIDYSAQIRVPSG